MLSLSYAHADIAWSGKWHIEQQDSIQNCRTGRHSCGDSELDFYDLKAAHGIRRTSSFSRFFSVVKSAAKKRCIF